ncbi:MAG: ferritin family protein [Desulfobacterales bacterium]
MKEKTQKNVRTAFIGGHLSVVGHAEKAARKGNPQIALLFRAIAEAERVHATRNLNLMKDVVVKDTDTNLEASFEREKSISENEYPDFLKDAEDEVKKPQPLCFPRPGMRRNNMPNCT